MTLPWYQSVDMELYIQLFYTFYFCFIFALTLVLYAWYFDVKEFKDNFIWFCYLPYGQTEGLCILDTNWFVNEMILLAILIVASIKLRKRVAKSYIKTFRAVKRNKNRASRSVGESKYRTIIAVQATNSVIPRLILIFLDFMYCSMATYGVYVYAVSRAKI